MAKEIAEEYASSLADLTVNSKPLINMLTILAEENIVHAGVIVETVEKHLEKVHADIKLPILYLIDSIIKNVGGAYTQKFSQIIVNLFTRTFKQVDEKVRSQMFKLRETWHEVFPATKLYQLDVKVNLIDPAWPIQAQPQQSNHPCIHVNPNFVKKPVATTSAAVPVVEDEKMRHLLAEKEQELLQLQRKKVEMELEQARRQLELAEKKAKGGPATVVNPLLQGAVAPVGPAGVAGAAPLPLAPELSAIPAKQRLGPPVAKAASHSGARIAPVSGALAAARRDPRLARRAPPAPTAGPAPAPAPVAPIAPNVFDIKPLDRVTKRKNVITIDVRPDAAEPRPQRDPRPPRAPRDPRRAPAAAAAHPHPHHQPPPPAPARPRPRDRDKKPESEKKNGDRADERVVDGYMDQLFHADPKKINKLPPIPKINRDEGKSESPAKKRKESQRTEKKKKRDSSAGSKDSSSGSSPEKRAKWTEEKKRRREEKEKRTETEPEPAETVAFKELKNFNKERYMRRNKEKSESPERGAGPAGAEGPADSGPAESDASNVPGVVVESKDVDLRVLPAVIDPKPAQIKQKRSSTEALENKSKKSKLDRFDKLFGSEDVDYRQLPQVEEAAAPPPPPSITESPKRVPEVNKMAEETKTLVASPLVSPQQKDWNEVKEHEESKKTPSKLDLVRAKLAEATKDRKSLLKSPSVERERRLITVEDTDLRTENAEDFDADDHKKTISIIMSQAKEQYSDGQLNKDQYNTLMFQVMQLNEKLKLKEAKQRESLEISKRKLKAHIEEENHRTSPKSPPANRYGDIDERVAPPDAPPYLLDSDMRLPMGVGAPHDHMDGPIPHQHLLPKPQGPPMFMGPAGPAGPPAGPFPPVWRGQYRPRVDEYGPRRMRGPAPPFYRGKFDKRAPRPPFEPRMQMPLPTPKMGTCQGECPLVPYERVSSPPPIGVAGYGIPPTDFRILEYIDQDPMKTIQIDGIPREIRFYGGTAIIMLDWDDPREIRFLPGSRRVTFDNKDSVVLSFEDGYKQVEIDDQLFDIKFGAPTRELFINGRWFECFFGGQPLGVLIDGKPRLIHLEGPMPQVDIGKIKRTDLVAGKINMIIDATHMCPVFLDAKVQKFVINGTFFTIRFADALRTVLINERPFRVEFGGLPKPIYVGNTKHFIRFSVLPRNVKPGRVAIANMEGCGLPALPPGPPFPLEAPGGGDAPRPMEVDAALVVQPSPIRTPSPESQGLDMLASLMPSTMAPSSASKYLSTEPLFIKSDKIPGLETPGEEEGRRPAPPALPDLGNINVTSLFAKLLESGLVTMPKEQPKEEVKETKADPKTEEVKQKKDDSNVIHHVDLLKPETQRDKQPALVSRMYGGMQCSGCGERFSPEHTVQYSQHLDWHFRQNRRERDSARRAHSRHYYYAQADWALYRQTDDLDEREKNWFEMNGSEAEGEAAAGAGAAGGARSPSAEVPSVPAGAPLDQHCALCGDKFDQFYNEDTDEWHLRQAVRANAAVYHPLCYEDHKAALKRQEAQEAQESAAGGDAAPPGEDAIEIKDHEDEDVNDQSDNESVVEVVEEPKPEEAPTVMEDVPVDVDVDVDADEEEDDDDVVLKAEPVVQVEVQDDGDTDDETQEARAERDRRAVADFAAVKIKLEPIDPDDEPIITAEEEAIHVSIEAPAAPATTVQSTIDGNVQLEAAARAAPPALPLGGIRINISKALPAPAAPAAPAAPTAAAPGAPHPDAAALPPHLAPDDASDEPLPPGEEPELEYKLKPALEGVQLSRQPPVKKGDELSGLCSIM